MYPIRFDLLDTPLEGGEHISVDGSCSKPSDGVYLCGYAVISDSGESELEVLEKQIHDLLERQTRLRERKTAMETSRADARKAASPGFKNTTSRNELHSCTCPHTAEGEIQDRSDDLSPTAATGLRDFYEKSLCRPLRDEIQRCGHRRLNRPERTRLLQ
ncbi:uncharacterized protein LOC130419633 isoform X2 [Triplophysa dalaica]|uniref:uncharacterized protein LOC130419633 isoform X2 n=1 Tax=Triplophysa dalaica TaxID=1582913 RepID=UPI0024DFC323|nr:uncharacterized protein LOC130419633 isoform X2 [Triplophysa dalaica]